MDYKQEMVKRLKDDCKILIEKKIPKALESVNDEKGQGINTYRNLTKALAENIKLIEEYENDYKPMWSVYKTGVNQDSVTPQVAVWMQNSNGDIDSHQVFDIDYGIKGENINGVLNISFEKEDEEEILLTDIIEELQNGQEDIYSLLYTVIDMLKHKGVMECANKKDNPFYDEWEHRFLMEHEMNNFKTKFDIGKNVRNIGKTTFLVNQAVKNNGVYVGASRGNVEYAKSIDPRVITCYGGTFGVSNGAKLYIDDGVDLKNIEGLNNASEYFMFRSK